MKSKKWMQVFVLITSIILLCAFLVGFTAPITVYAAEDGTVHASSTEGDPKPANALPKLNLKPYSDKLAQNNEKFKALNKIAEVKEKEKEEDKEDGDDDAVFTKEKVADFAKENYNDWTGEAFELIAFIKGAAEGEEVDWEKFGVETTKKVIYAFAAYLGYGDITKTVIEGLESLLTSGEEPLSEMEKLTDTLDQEFNGMNDKLYEIEDQLGSVSNQITTSVNDILGGTQTQIDNLESKEILRKFMSSGEGNFSYNEFTNYLYGNNNSSSRSNEAYYNLLMRAIYNGESDDVIKYYYDKLFESIYTNMPIYNEYYYGNVAGLDKSVVCYYYDYLIANPALVPEGSTAEYEAIQFAFDLYTTYVYAYNLMNMCYAYQITDINLQSFANGEMNVPDTAYYSYTATDRITYGTIKTEIANMDQYIHDAEAQMMYNVSYIMGMADSYIVLDDDGYFHEAVNNSTTYGNVVDGQTVYLNVLSDELLELFSVSRSNFEYYIDGERVLNPAEEATIDVASIPNDTFVVTVKYFGVEIYSIVFNKNITNDFAGGNGSENDPYLINNLEQFLMVSDDMSAHYKLIDDIYADCEIRTMGSIEDPFTGTFDGNGHTIEKLTIYSLEKNEENVTMTPTTGLFGVISSDGTVKDLTLRDVNVRALEDEDGIGLESERCYFYVGVIAGVNDGLITNCTVEGDSSLTFDRSKDKDTNRSLDVCVGGIAGTNNGVIGYCTVNGVAISADTSSFEFGGNSPAVNKNALYAGGIAGRSSGNITCSRVGSETSIDIIAAAVANTSNRVTPYLISYAGGIVGDPDAKDRLSNVYSECTDICAGGFVYNEGTYWGINRYNRDNEKVLQGHYYPIYSGFDFDEEGCAEWEQKFHSEFNNCASKYRDPQNGYISEANLIRAGKEAKELIKKKVEKIISEKEPGAKEGIAAESYNDSCFTYTEPEYVTVLLNSKSEYEVGSKFVDLTKLSVVDMNGEVLDVEYIGCYGFDSTNPSLTETRTIAVTVFYVVEYEGDSILKCDTLEITIGVNKIVSNEIVGFMQAPLNINTSTEDALDQIFTDGFEIVYYYANGEKDIYSILRGIENDNSSEVTITGIDTSAIGEITITVKHGEEEISIKVKVSCSHPNGMKFDSAVDANCKFMGYDVYKCDDCGFKIHKNYHAGNHNYVVVGGTEATCHEPGYTQSVKCSVCDTVFESSEWIQALPHDYITIEEAMKSVLDFVQNDAYVNKDYHYCVNGNHYEPHQYVVTESSSTDGKMIYIYTCVTCGYVSEVIDENITTDAAGDIPVVFITDGYVLGTGDEVVVYVQILNNPGFNGANFGIRYTDGLELIAFEESTMVPAQLRVNNEVHNGYNFLWASGSGNSEGDGYLLKLTFKYVAENGEKQTIDVVYGMQEEQDDYGDTVNNLGGFTSSSDKNVISRFMTHSGSVTLVDHLPGDVNDDGVVDIMDATIIAWSIVGKTDSDGNKITVERRYADINLDGKVDLNDVIAVLQAVSGRYGTNLLNSEYKVILNLAGFKGGDITTSFDINFYNDDNTRTKWSDNIDFEAIKEQMNRLGYTFVGWYTRLEGGELVDVDGNISFDDMQGTQTLYARWEKNKVIFDMGGSNGEAFEDVVYTDAEPTLTPDTPTWSYDVEYVVENYDGIYGDSSYKLYKDFLGWYIGDTPVSQYDLSTPNIGTVTLVAKWADTYNWEKPTETRRGYADITKWYYKQAYNSNYLISVVDDAMIAELAKSNYRIYGQQNIIKYSITYEDLKGATNVNNDYFYVTSDFALSNLESVTGYDFAGWYDKLGNKIVKVQDTVGDMTLVAKWNPKVYEIVVKGTDVNSFTISGNNVIYSATDKNLFTLYYKYGVGYYLESACTNALPAKYFSNYCATQPGYSNYYIDGLYMSPINNNAHSNASIESTKLVIGSDNTAHRIPELNEANRNGTLYAKLLPNKYTITFNHSSHNLIDNAYLSANWSGNNLDIAYNASSGVYTLTNTDSADPNASINQWVTLEAGVQYTMHMDISSSGSRNSVQVFYAIGGAYSEANSLTFSGSQSKTFTVSASGKYLIRIDNDCNGNATISNFWISKTRTEKIDVYYNESPASITAPTSAFYNFAGYKYNGSVGYYDASGAPLQPYAISGNATFDAQWTQKYSGTYIKTAAELSNIRNNTSGVYYIVCDIPLSGDWTMIPSFSGTLDGLGHTIGSLKISLSTTDANPTENVGMFQTFSGTLRNVVFSSINVTHTGNKDNIHNNNVGGIAGKMTGGLIENVTVNYAYVDNTHYRDVAGDGNKVNSYVGGIVGYASAGTIKNCTILGGNIRANAKRCEDEADAHASSGAILGRGESGVTVSGCTRADAVTVYSYAEQRTDEWSQKNSAVRSAAGGIVGSGGCTVTGCTSSTANLSANWSVHKKTSDSSYCLSGAQKAAG